MFDSLRNNNNNGTDNSIGVNITDYNEQFFVSWFDVGIAWSFILVSVLVSFGMGTRLGLPIFMSSIRCLVQLTVMGLVLDGVMRSESIFLVVLVTLVLVVLGGLELSFIQSKKTIRHFFMITLLILFISNVTIAVLGSTYALRQEPFWEPSKYIPVLGILLGKSMSSIAMTTHQCLDSINAYGPVLETRLAFGATRYEAIKPFAAEVIRLSMLPIIMQLSVMGMINIPGTMVGLILAGKPITDAVIYQQCIMFMVAASSGLGVLLAVMICMFTVINKKHAVCWNEVWDRKPLLQLNWIRCDFYCFTELFSIRSFASRCCRRRTHSMFGGNNNRKKQYRYEQLELQIQVVQEEATAHVIVPATLPSNVRTPTTRI